MGGFHIEHAGLVCLGQLLFASDMKKILFSSFVHHIVGLMTTVCNVNNIKKVRYTFQVIAVVLIKTLKDALESSGSVDTVFI